MRLPSCFISFPAFSILCNVLFASISVSAIVIINKFINDSSSFPIISFSFEIRYSFALLRASFSLSFPPFSLMYFFNIKAAYAVMYTPPSFLPVYEKLPSSFWFDKTNKTAFSIDFLFINSLLSIASSARSVSNMSPLYSSLTLKLPSLFCILIISFILSSVVISLMEFFLYRSSLLFSYAVSRYFTAFSLTSPERFCFPVYFNTSAVLYIPKLFPHEPSSF